MKLEFTKKEVDYFKENCYFTDEEEHEDLEYVEKDINIFIKLGKQYDLYNDKNIKYLQDWFEEEKKYLEKV